MYYRGIYNFLILNVKFYLVLRPLSVRRLQLSLSANSCLFSVCCKLYYHRCYMSISRLAKR